MESTSANYQTLSNPEVTEDIRWRLRALAELLLEIILEEHEHETPQ